MCFTPGISLTTFFIEIALAIWILYRNPKNRLNQVGAAVLFLLGFYQFTEFMLCTSVNPLLWGKMAHLAYTFLPALSIHWVFALRNQKKNLIAIYILPVIFAILAIFTTGFIKSAFCDRYFIEVLINWNSLLWYWGYGLYYSGFILIALVLLIRSIMKENNKKQRKIYSWGLIGLLSFTFPTFWLILAFPALNINAPSILCEFALLFGIIISYIIYLTEKKH